jgi:hypothetical protein
LTRIIRTEHGLSFLILSKSGNRKKNEKKTDNLMNLCFFFAYFAPVKTKGCPQRGAEIIP